MATGFPVKANYATGDVLTAANMNDLSGTVNYLQYMPPRNPVLNSSYNVWQRGTSFSTSTNNTYTADRWSIFPNGNTCTVSRQATSDTTNLPNIQYCARVQRNSGQTGTGAAPFYQAFETINTIPFAGKTVILSFYARAGANYSPTSSALSYKVYFGTGTDQNPFSAGYTGSTNTSSSATLTTTWQRFTYSFSVASTVTELTLSFEPTWTGTAGANDYFEVTGVQLELGSVANTYMPNQPTYQGELAACQRYYWRTTATTSATAVQGFGAAASTTSAGILITYPTTMRTEPTSLDYSTLELGDSVNAASAVTSLSMDSSQTTERTAWLSAGVASGLTQYRPYSLRGANNTASYLGFSAEL